MKDGYNNLSFIKEIEGNYLTTKEKRLLEYGIIPKTGLTSLSDVINKLKASDIIIYREDKFSNDNISIIYNTLNGDSRNINNKNNITITHSKQLPSCEKLLYRGKEMLHEKIKQELSYCNKLISKGVTVPNKEEIESCNEYSNDDGIVIIKNEFHKDPAFEKFNESIWGELEDGFIGDDEDELKNSQEKLKELITLDKDLYILIMNKNLESAAKIIRHDNPKELELLIHL